MNNNKSYVKKVEEVNEEDVYDMLHQIEESNESIKKSEIKNTISIIARQSRIRDINKKEIKKRIITLIASIGIFFGVSKGYFELSDKVLSDNYQEVYSATLTYNEETGYSKEEKYVPIKEASEGTYIKIYEPWNMKSEREVRTYDISSLGEMDLEEYLKLNLEEMGIDYSSTMESISESGDLLNKEEIREVIKNIVFYDRVGLNTLAVLIAFIIYLLLVGIVIDVDVSKYFPESYFLMFSNSLRIKWCKENIWHAKYYVDVSCSDKNTLDYYNAIKIMIKENNELRNKFVEEFNKLKCSDPSEIMEEFKRVCDMVDIDRLEEDNSLVLKELKKRGVL